MYPRELVKHLYPLNSSISTISLLCACASATTTFKSSNSRFHPECVSALRRMQVETLLALQRWICRRCYQRSKRYRDLKTFQRSEKSSHRSGGGGGRSRGSRGRSSKGAGGDDGSSSSSSSGSESSGGGQAARALAARKRPQLSLGAELTKLLPDAPTASGLGKPRFIR